MLSSVARHFPGQPVLIRADRATAYEHVIRVLDLCRQADIWNVSFATGGSETAVPR
jgi:biopolymer transport protein ExbD